MVAFGQKGGYKDRYLDIVHCCIATDSFCVVVQVVENVPANVKIEWILSCPEG